MNTEALKRKLSGKLSLPSLPEVIVRLQDMISDPDVGMNELGVELASDPPLAARVLRIANSAYYGLRVPVLDISHATAVLGLETMGTLLMQVGVMDVVGHLEREPGFDPRQLWEHSVFTAQLAGSFPRRCYRTASKDELYVCGLLHDIGKFVLFDHLHDEYLECVRRARETGSLWAVEQEHFGFSHADVGALITERWKLPPAAVRAIGEHHDLEGNAASDPVVAITALANILARAMRGKKAPRLVNPLPEGPIECLQLTEEEIDELLERALALQATSRASSSSKEVA
jgi:putative nucleotidyltransferase with HDIG domain